MKYLLLITLTLFALGSSAQAKRDGASMRPERPGIQLDNAFALPYIKPNKYYTGSLRLKLSDYDLKGFQGAGDIKNLRVSAVHGVPKPMEYKIDVFKLNPKDYALSLKLRGTIPYDINRRIAVDLSYQLDYDGQRVNLVRSIDNISLQTKNAAYIQRHFLRDKVFKNLSAWPNPCRFETHINFDATMRIAGTLQVINALGKVVCSKRFSARRGHNTLLLQRGDCNRYVPNGLYFYRLQTPGESALKRLIIR